MQWIDTIDNRSQLTQEREERTISLTLINILNPLMQLKPRLINLKLSYNQLLKNHFHKEDHQWSKYMGISKNWRTQTLKERESQVSRIKWVADQWLRAKMEEEFTQISVRNYLKTLKFQVSLNTTNLELQTISVPLV